MRHALFFAALWLTACQAAPPAAPSPSAPPKAPTPGVHEAEWSAATGGLNRGQVGLATLEHPAGTVATGDTEGAGVDVVPFFVDRNEDFSLVFHPNGTLHSIELRGPDHLSLAVLDAKRTNFRATLAPGRYRLILRHDGTGDAGSGVPFFIKYNPRAAAPAAFRVQSTAPSVADLEVGAGVCASCDMSGMYLRGADLHGAELPGAKLSRAELSDANLADANLEGADLSHINGGGALFTRADLEGAHLAQSNLKGATFFGARLVDADLSGADLSVSPVGAGQTGLSRADLSGASLELANLTGVDMTNVMGKGASFAAATLDHTRLDGADLEGAVFEGTRVRADSLQSTVVKGASFKGAHMPGAVFRRVTLAANDFTGAILDGAQFQYATIYGENIFTGISGVEADFTYAQIGPVSFRLSNMARSTFFGASVGGADVRGANLSNANLMVAPQSGFVNLAPPTITDGVVPSALIPPQAP